jgi:signal transduction histidine kinase
VAFYRICQEALNNIAKHADASQVEIDLQYDASAADVTGMVQAPLSVAPTGAPQVVVINSVEMRIRDDGQGFDPGELSAPGHYGLGMMCERAASVGAQVTVTSRPGHGTEVTLRWPGTPEQEAL